MGRPGGKDDLEGPLSGRAGESWKELGLSGFPPSSEEASSSQFESRLWVLLVIVFFVISVLAFFSLSSLTT